jgi:hypothetical protein
LKRGLQEYKPARLLSRNILTHTRKRGLISCSVFIIVEIRTNRISILSFVCRTTQKLGKFQSRQRCTPNTFRIRVWSVLSKPTCSYYVSQLNTIVGGWGGVQLGPLDNAATNRPIASATSDYDNGEIAGMIGRGTRSTPRKPPPILLCPPQTPHAARTRTQATAM